MLYREKNWLLPGSALPCSPPSSFCSLPTRYTSTASCFPALSVLYQHWMYTEMCRKLAPSPGIWKCPCSRLEGSTGHPNVTKSKISAGLFRRVQPPPGHSRSRRQVSEGRRCQELCEGRSSSPGGSASPCPGCGLCGKRHRCTGDIQILTDLLPPPGCHDKAVLLYEYVGKRIVDLQHTEVPDAYRGRGIAKHLAKAALDFVVEEDLKAHLTCWYIQKYVKENPLPQYLEHLQP
nr:PREDICTED: protein GTLF3B [Struthio camelus australis]